MPNQDLLAEMPNLLATKLLRAIFADSVPVTGLNGGGLMTARTLTDVLLHADSIQKSVAEVNKNLPNVPIVVVVDFHKTLELLIIRLRLVDVLPKVHRHLRIQSKAPINALNLLC